MGLKDKLKKQKGDKEKPEEIGGLLEDAVLPGRLSYAPLAVGNVPEIPESPEEPFAQGFPDVTEDIDESPKSAKNDDDLSALDIFTAETAEDEEESRLADQLPQIDIHDLLTECRKIADMLKQNIE